MPFFCGVKLNGMAGWISASGSGSEIGAGSKAEGGGGVGAEVRDMREGEDCLDGADPDASGLAGPTA